MATEAPRTAAVDARATAAAPPRGRLVVLSGAAGSGKSTIVARLLEQRRDLPVRRSISATTRPPRPGEVDGVDYYFVSVDQFEADRDAGRYLEWAKVHNHYYATPLAPIERLRDQGLSIILVIDVQGAMTVRAKVPDALLVFVQAPSFAVLEQRLRDRQTDSEATIALRLRNAQREVALSNEYDHQVVNDSLDHAVQQLADLLQPNLPGA